MQLYTTNPINSLTGLIRVTALMTGQKLEMITVDDAMKKSKEMKEMNHTGLYPLLKTKEGTLNESVAIAKYLCSLADGKLLGKTAVEQSHVDQWISFANTTVMPCGYQVNMGIFGWGEITQTKWNEESKNLKAHIKVLNTALEGKKFLVGDSATLADLVLIDYLFYNFQTVLDGGFRKAMKNVDAWAQACLDLPEFVKVFGKVQMCAKPLKPTCVQEKKEPAKKAAAPPPQPKAEKAEKPKDNVESLPPTPFNLFDFKTLLINHPDIKGKGVDTFYEMLDWEGWSFWFLHYDKYGSEGTKLHVTNNLMTGFLSRAEHTTKYTFGRHCVLGEEPNLEIMGVWLMRGAKELPDGLVKEHAQFEYYRTRQLDPRNNKDDDKLVREFFSAQAGGTCNGLAAQTLRWQK